MRKIEYIGCFFSQEAVLEKAAQQCEDRLYRSIINPHVTFAYHPDTIPYEAFGSPITVTVVSYGRDDENEAFGVVFGDLPEMLQLLAENIRVPHITVSVSRSGKPVNSKYIRYEPIEPFTLQGVFGGLDMKGNVCTQKTEVYNGDGFLLTEGKEI